MVEQIINIDPEIHSGLPVFMGSRVPVKALFEYLKSGETLETFLEDFPTVRRELAVALLALAQSEVLDKAKLAAA